jgi:hypothetical protein
MTMARAQNGGCVRLVNARFEGSNAPRKFGVNDASLPRTHRKQFRAV